MPQVDQNARGKALTPQAILEHLERLVVCLIDLIVSQRVCLSILIPDVDAENFQLVPKWQQQTLGYSILSDGRRYPRCPGGDRRSLVTSYCQMGLGILDTQAATAVSGLQAIVRWA